VVGCGAGALVKHAGANAASRATNLVGIVRIVPRDPTRCDRYRREGTVIQARLVMSSPRTRVGGGRR
jgi:hypothetical protein